MTPKVTVLMPRDSSARQPMNSDPQTGDVARLALEIIAKPEEVRGCFKDIHQAFEAAELPSELRINTEVVLAEVLNNIAEHSYSDRPPGLIKMQLDLSDDGVWFLAVDDGKVMPNLTPPDPELPEVDVELNDLPEGGFGWFLIRTLTADLEYSRVGTCNHLSARIPFDP